jgi:hypothetical protein
VRIATITNWAYGATVCLTIASGIIMLMASSADTLERQAVEQRQKFDQLTEDIETDIWAQSDLARLYVIKKDPQVLKEYNQAENSLKSIELRLEKLQDNGASDEELALLHEGIKIVDELQDEQQTALESLSAVKTRRPLPALWCSPMSRSWSARRTRSITSARYSTNASSPPFRRRQKNRKRCVPPLS